MSLLPGLTQSAPGVPIFAPASGGGGGGGGANPAFSTITINNGILTTNSSANGFVFQNSTTPVIQDAYLQSLTAPLAAGSGTANIFQLNSSAGSANTMTLGAGDDNASYIWSGAAGTQDGSQALYIKSAGVFMSSLSVSSINGAAPGGGGAPVPNPSFSSISFDSNAPLNVLDSLIIANAATAVTNDISFLTNQSANSVVTNVQPGGVGSVVAISPAAGTGTNLNLAGTDVGGAIIASAVNASGAPSTLTVSCDNLKLAQPNTLNATLNIFGTDTNLFALQVRDSNASLVTEVDFGLVGSRNQVYINSNAQIQNDLWVSSISRCAAATVSSFTVSSINGAAPGGGGLSNFTIPFITGSGDGTTWTVNVDSNTGGIPVALTSTLVVSPANSYLVSYSLFGGSNSDTSQYTKLEVYTASGTSPIIQTCPGLVSNNWLSNGFMGARSLIVSGASAIRLQAEDYSPTVSTILYFDQNTAFKVTNLGASS